MSAEAALVYFERFGVAPGRTIVVATNNGLAHAVAAAFARHADVTLVDGRKGVAGPEGLRMLAGRRIVRAEGLKAVSEVKLDDGTRLAADCVLVSGGFTPTIHLYGEAQGKLAWDESILAFVPAPGVDCVTAVGAAVGRFGLHAVGASVQGAMKGLGIDAAVAAVDGAERPNLAPAWPRPKMPGRVWRVL